MASTLVVAGPVEAAFPGSNGKIAFASEGHIEIINADGTGRATLDAAAPASSVNEPAWNATATKLVFRDSGSSFRTMNANGSNEQPLVGMPSFAGNPTWSASGSVVAFDSFIGGPQQESRIYTVPAAGGTATELIALNANDPTYSPDGTKIAFENRADGCCDIGVMNANGTSPVTITSGPSGNAGDQDPSWSPDGSKIAFKRSDQIWTVSADGSGAIQLTTGTAASYPTWSPDGTKVAFERGDDIWVMDPDGSDAVNITNTPAEDEKEPDWGICTGSRCPPPPPQCSVTWDGGAGTSAWHDVANWDSAALPGPGDDVCILDSNDLTVIHSQGATQIASLLTREAFVLSGGNLELQSTLRKSLAYPRGDAADPVFTLTGGTLSGAGTLVATSLEWTGGTMSGPGATVVDPGVVTGAGLVDPAGILGGALKNLLNGHDFVIHAGEVPPMEPPDGEPPPMEPPDGEPPDGEPPPMEPPDGEPPPMEPPKAGFVEWRAGDIELSGGSQIVNNGYFQITDSVDLAQGEGTEPIRFTNNGTLEMNAAAEVFGIEPATSFTNDGTLRVTAGTVDIRGTFTNFNAASRTLSGGDYLVAGTLSFTDAALGSLSADISLTGTGRILDHLGNDALSFLEGIDRSSDLSLRDGYDLTTTSAFSNSGEVTIGPGSVLEVGGPYTQDGGSTELSGPTSVLTTAQPVQIDGGRLSGVGTLRADVVNAATVAPGRSPGTLRVDGDYRQSGTGILSVEFTKRKSDRMTVLGNADLGGKLVVDGVKKPRVGKKFTIVTADKLAGRFNKVTVRGLDRNRGLMVQFNQAAAILLIVRR